MKIAINGYFLTRPYTGLGNYTRGLLRALGSIKHNHTFVVMVPEHVDDQFGAYITVEYIPAPKRVGPSIGKFWWEQWTVPKHAKNHGAQLIHHLYPATSVLTSIPQVTSIHDATPWHFPEHNYSTKIRWLRRFTKKASRRARLIVTVSQTAQEDISAEFQLSESKIIPIYNGIDDIFRALVSERQHHEVMSKYHIRWPYIFYIGGFEIHKNVRRLFLAYTKAVSEIDAHLVLAGGVFSKTRPPVYRDYFELPEFIKNYQLEHRVHMIGTVPHEDLPALYQNAKLFVSPSLAEGFNIPLVEAMASRVPIVCSKIPVNQEIAIDHAGKKAAMFVDTTDVSSLASTIMKVINRPTDYREQVQTAWRRQQEFTWEHAANALVRLYDTLATSGLSRSSS